MSDDKKRKSNSKRLLPALLLAGTLAAPALAAPPDLGDLIRQAERTDRQVLIDSQANYGDPQVVTAPQWAEVTWGKVVWVRADNRDY